MGSRERHILPVPRGISDGVEHEIHDVADDSLRYRIRRLVERAYADGYEDGHLTGTRERDSDLRAARDAERTAAEGG